MAEQKHGLVATFLWAKARFKQIAKNFLTMQANPPPQGRTALRNESHTPVDRFFAVTWRLDFDHAPEKIKSRGHLPLCRLSQFLNHVNTFSINNLLFRYAFCTRCYFATRPW